MVISEVHERDVLAFKDGKFILDVEQCDEDGSVCPSGDINWLTSDWNAQQFPEDSPIVEVCSIDPEDAETFVLAIYDRHDLLTALTERDAHITALEAKVAELLRMVGMATGHA